MLPLAECHARASQNTWSMWWACSPSQNAPRETKQITRSFRRARPSSPRSDRPLGCEQRPARSARSALLLLRTRPGGKPGTGAASARLPETHPRERRRSASPLGPRASELVALRSGPLPSPPATRHRHGNGLGGVVGCHHQRVQVPEAVCQ